MQNKTTGNDWPANLTWTHKPDIEPVIEVSKLPPQLENKQPSVVVDQYSSQVSEYLRLREPTRSFSEDELNQITSEYLDREDAPKGNWVYYPWLDTAVRVLNEEMYRTVRTSRNKYKITEEETSKLRAKVIGVVGLSVGQAAAITLAMESVGGTLRLADFDRLDLSNLNRLRAGVHQLGLPKTIIAAREIAQIDPYLNVELYHEGITPENAQTFLSGLDLVVEECDSLPIKILIRHIARQMHLPVIMDTSDRGMVDVERFDLEPDRAIFHGKLKSWEGKDPATFTNEDRQALLFSLVDYEKASDRAKSSFAEIGKTITTWPQLASAVTLGGAMMTDCARRILLGEDVKSGRFYVDLEQLIGTDD